jgi:hypothetical protein
MDEIEDTSETYTTSVPSEISEFSEISKIQSPVRTLKLDRSCSASNFLWPQHPEMGSRLPRGVLASASGRRGVQASRRPGVQASRRRLDGADEAAGVGGDREDGAGGGREARQDRGDEEFRGGAVLGARHRTDVVGDGLGVGEAEL